MSTKHTPGPYRVLRDVNGRFHVIAGGSDTLASLWHPGRNPGAMEKNAHLFAAAPDLLDALYEMIGVHAVPSAACKERPAYEKAIAALKKAAGESE